MLAKQNVYSQRVNATEVPLHYFYIIGADVYKHSRIPVGKTVILRFLA